MPPRLAQTYWLALPLVLHDLACSSEPFRMSAAMSLFLMLAAMSLFLMLAAMSLFLMLAAMSLFLMLTAMSLYLMLAATYPWQQAILVEYNYFSLIF